MRSIESRVSNAEKQLMAAACDRGDGFSYEEQEEVIKAVFSEYLAVAQGEPVDRVHSIRTDLSARTLLQVCNLAHAIRAPIEDVLPNMPGLDIAAAAAH